MAEPATRTGISRRLVILMAVAGGASVANLYYAQPLLEVIAQSLGVSIEAAGLIVTFTQVGYLFGIVALVPLGDMVERRRYVPRVLVVAAVALTCTALAPSLPVIAIALVVVGVTSVGAQLLIPFAATLARDDERGTVMGIVMSGVLLGVLLARTVSGLLAELGGWRLVYGCAAVLMLTLAVVLSRSLPLHPPSDLDRLPPVVRLGRPARALRAASATPDAALVPRLRGLHDPLDVADVPARDPPFDYSEGAIGLFGLLGIGGAIAAQVAGRSSTAATCTCRRAPSSRRSSRAGGSWRWGGPTSLALGAGIVLLDLGVQGANITSQTMIYAVRPEARSRMTTGYMTAVFLGAATGSALSGSSTTPTAGRACAPWARRSPSWRWASSPRSRRPAPATARRAIAGVRPLSGPHRPATSPDEDAPGADSSMCRSSAQREIDPSSPACEPPSPSPPPCAGAGPRRPR